MKSSEGGLNAIDLEASRDAFSAPGTEGLHEVDSSPYRLGCTCFFYKEYEVKHKRHQDQGGGVGEWSWLWLEFLDHAV